MRNRLPSLLLGLGLTAVILAAAALLTVGWRQQASAAQMRVPGPVDVGFAQSMSLHHQQAIAMSQLLLDGRPSGLTPLAKQIGYSQLLELGEMRGWLKLWEAPLLPPQITMDWMLLGATPPDHDLLQYLLACQASPTGMSGLATNDELEQLRRLEGLARDRHFLELMLLHHQGGLPMAQFAAAEAKLPVVRQLALRTVVEQSEEVAFIQRALAAIEDMASRPNP